MGQEQSKWHCSFTDASPTYSATKRSSRLAHPGDYLRLCPTQFVGVFYMESKQLYLIHRNKHREAAKLRRQRNMAKMKEQNKIPEKELNKTEITNLSDAELKTLVIRMLKELTEYSNNIKEEMRVTLREINKNLQGTNSEGKEARIQISDLEHKEEINIQPEQKEETRIQKNEDRLRNLQDNFKPSNI